jgi:hypothetical protein
MFPNHNLQRMKNNRNVNNFLQIVNTTETHHVRSEVLIVVKKMMMFFHAMYSHVDMYNAKPLTSVNGKGIPGMGTPNTVTSACKNAHKSSCRVNYCCVTLIKIGMCQQ